MAQLFSGHLFFIGNVQYLDGMESRRLTYAGLVLDSDPVQSAKAVGLRYVIDHRAGIRRVRVGSGFRYIGPQGKTIKAPDELRRIKSLVIPPAWQRVWICPFGEGHLQATGRDAKGRKQYRYHPRWRAVRDETKYNRMIEFGKVLPKIRAQVQRDLQLTGLPRAKVLATVVRLLEVSLIRVGNEEYARQNGSYGLTTLRDKHVQVNGSTLQFHFRGKSGKEHKLKIDDARLARIVKKCQDLPGQELFQYVDSDGAQQVVASEDVNQYLKEISGQDFTAKDFRTWSGTVLAARALLHLAGAETKTQAKKMIVQAIEAVAQLLGNTPAVCRKCYVHPAVLEAYLDGELVKAFSARARSGNAPRSLRPDEKLLLKLLEQRFAAECRARSNGSPTKPGGGSRKGKSGPFRWAKSRRRQSSLPKAWRAVEQAR